MKKKTGGFLKEFKAFISRGNVLDMAVGIIIGAAFGAIVTAIVQNIIMPSVGYLIGGVNFSDLKIVLKGASTAPDGSAVPEVAIMYGMLIQKIIEFFIIAFTLFVCLKVVSATRRKKDVPPAPIIVDEKLVVLTQIKDLLQSNMKVQLEDDVQENIE